MRRAMRARCGFQFTSFQLREVSSSTYVVPVVRYNYCAPVFVCLISFEAKYPDFEERISLKFSTNWSRNFLSFYGKVFVIFKNDIYLYSSLPKTA